MKQRLIVLTGAGMSAESGIPTFRDSNGLWENHLIEDVATPGAWERNPDLVLEFYNQRRKNVLQAEPNRGHRILAALEDKFEVHIITQNIDNLHERAGSSSVLHLHGEITKARSAVDENHFVDIEGWELKKGMLCPYGTQLRPFIVWFGEEVPMLEAAERLVATADIFAVVGTSLQVYPAAGLIHSVPPSAKRYIIDPNIPESSYTSTYTGIAKGAGEGLEELSSLL